MKSERNLLKLDEKCTVVPSSQFLQSLHMLANKISIQLCNICTRRIGKRQVLSYEGQLLLETMTLFCKQGTHCRGFYNGGTCNKKLRSFRTIWEHKVVWCSFDNPSTCHRNTTVTRETLITEISKRFLNFQL